MPQNSKGHDKHACLTLSTRIDFCAIGRRPNIMREMDRSNDRVEYSVVGAETAEALRKIRQRRREGCHNPRGGLMAVVSRGCGRIGQV
jgi:hypothetical protein